MLVNDASQHKALNNNSTEIREQRISIQIKQLPTLQPRWVK